MPTLNVAFLNVYAMVMGVINDLINIEHEARLANFYLGC